MTPLSPEKRFDREDPTDSQTGECETLTRALKRSEFKTKRVNEETTAIE